MYPDYYIGLDLGKDRDFSAVAIVERFERRLNTRDPVSFAFHTRTSITVRHAERIRLGTSYPHVANRIAQIVSALPFSNSRHLIPDATGVGSPVVDMLKRARLDAIITPVVITGADSESESKGTFRVPKRDLIEGLQIMIQSGDLEFAGGMPGLQTLMRELSAIRRWVAPSGHEVYGARKSGEHDDLVLAVALACWRLRKVKRYTPSTPSDYRIVMG